VDLVGYSGGFASGKYGVLTPFFNGIFSGKIARFTTLEVTYSLTHSLTLTYSFLLTHSLTHSLSLTYLLTRNQANTLAANVQELDLTRERNPTYVGRYKGYRGGFVSLWSGTDD